MPKSMAQEQSFGVRRRSLESPMKEAQARTKVVLRHLPPSISQVALLESVDSKFAGCYTWFSFRPGKASVKRQVLSRAYINFKKPEDVYDFYEEFDGHVFVNEKGTQYKVTVEYAPYQRIPKPRSKKDIREGTITKDSDYLEFLEMLGKPVEYLPSAEVQLERREAEKAAALGAGGGRETVVITPLMEFVRQRRAAKSAPQRSLSSKLGARSGGVTVVTSSLPTHKRGLERSRSGPLMYVPENSISVGLSSQKESKEVSARELTAGQRREEQQQRKERDVVIERRKKEFTEGKEKKPVHEVVPTLVSSSKGNAAVLQLETSKENTNAAVSTKDTVDMLTALDSKGNETQAVDVEQLSSHVSVTGKAAIVPISNEGGVGDVWKELNKREVAKRKHLTVVKDKLQKDLEVGPTSPGQPSTGAYNQRHRPPVSPRVGPGSTQSQLATFPHAAASGEGASVAAASKPNHRRELLGKNTKGALSPRDQQSPSNQHASSNALLLDSQTRSQQGSPQSERGGKRPPRPHSARLTGKELTSNFGSPSEAEVGPISDEKFSSTSTMESFSGADRQDARRVRNKDRPDRPVWTPRRRSDATPGSDASSAASAASTSATVLSNVSDLGESDSKTERTERGLHRPVGKSALVTGQHWVESVGAGQLPEGARGQSGSGSIVTHSSVSGKTRYVESNNARAARGARAISGNAVSIQEHTIFHGEERSDVSLSVTTVDPKGPQISLYNTKENGENHFLTAADKEKQKQDTALVWNELTGGSHRSGDRRREKNAQHGSRDGDGSMAAAEIIKPTKRGGNLTLGGSEKQVWVAVQKSGSGT